MITNLKQKSQKCLNIFVMPSSLHRKRHDSDDTPAALIPGFSLARRYEVQDMDRRNRTTPTSFHRAPFDLNDMDSSLKTSK